METKLIVAFVALAICLFTPANAKKYCTQDSECEELGGLSCIKSSCNYGICACPRSTVARWLGSERLYQCVPLKKIGESCSTDGDAGVCGAPGSRCNGGTCECSSGVSVWGGEYCATDSQKTGPGESCSNSIGSCSLSSGSTCMSSTGVNWYDALTAFDYPTCSCPNDKYLAISNWYFSFDYIGRKIPSCNNKLIGDFCLLNADCANINGVGTSAVCTNNACACPSNTVQSYDTATCTNGTALGFGATCAGTGYTGGACDGSLGLVCGDICTLYESAPTSQTCVCGAYHTTSGSTCTARGIGSTCFGDQNCKGIGHNAICVDGKCENGAKALAVTMGTLFVALLAAIFVW